MTLNNLGTVLSDLGKRDAARTAFTEALTIYTAAGATASGGL